MASLPDGVPGYRLVRVLGQGGMATVYLATQESLGREVALKLLAERYAQDPEAAGRFVREARTAARLVHRHIVGIHDVGTHDGRPYLAMEYLPGGTLPAGRTSPAEALQAVREIALALDHAHAQGVVHRDIKPENILRRADGSHALADFGIARTADTATVMTREGITLGTPHYMSPEQLQGKPLDGRADLYSLGVVLYQLLTGALPYQGTDGWSIGVQHLTAAIPRLPPELARYQPLVDRLMAKDPADRPQTGADAAQLLDAALAGLTPAPAPVTVAVPRVSAARQRRVVMALAAIAVLGFLGWAGWQLLAQRDAAATASTAAAAATAAAADRSIAVLPLANLGGKADNEYFSDGLAETVLDMLARSPDLRVIARSSSFAFKGKDVDVRQIGRTLGAAHLLQGSVQQSGDTVRIRAQLVRAADGAVLWSSQYDRQLADVFKIQDEVATEVVTALQGALPQAQRARVLAKRTADVAAYREYLKGNELLRLRRVDDLREALQHYQRAIAIDPQYAGAYVGAANTLILLQTHAGLTPEEQRECERLVARALALDPNSGEAHVARAAIAQSAKDYGTAQREFRRGLELSPSYATGWQWYGEFLSIDLGRMQEALPAIERATRLDPLAPIILAQLGRTYQALGRMAEAEKVAQRLVRDFPRFPQGHGFSAEILAARGDLAGALKASEQAIAADPSSTRSRIERCQGILEAGAFEQADACRAALDGRSDAVRFTANFDFLRALSRNDLAAARRVVDKAEGVQGWQKAWMLRMEGHAGDAMEIYRQMWPQWLAQPLGEPVVAAPFDAIDVAAGLQQLGRDDQAAALLRYVLAHSRGRPHGGINGWGYADVFAHALLGEHPEACAAIDRATRDGFVNSYFLLATDRDLTGLRKHACFAPAYARVEALARERIRKAEAAGAL